MAAGDNFINCTNDRNLSLEQVLRQMVYDDGTGKPIISLNPNTTLQPWYTCNNANISLKQVARLLIVEDGNGKPAWRVTNT